MFVTVINLINDFKQSADRSVCPLILAEHMRMIGKYFHKPISPSV